jgi:poly-beta-1,6-N-acetyl-D-glucosamine N-deacetylase
MKLDVSTQCNRWFRRVAWSIRWAAIGWLFIFNSSAAAIQNHAVILMYHHVAGDTPRSTSVTPDTFERHLQFLHEHDFRVMPLTDLIEAIRKGDPVPKRAVAITFDDAYASVYTEAAPRLRARQWPYTIFVSTDYIDQKLRPYMAWPQLRELADAGVTLGNHTLSHANLVRIRSTMPMEEWRATVRREILDSQARLAEMAGNTIDILAYPYGETDPATSAIVEELGFIGLGQQSGAVGPSTDWLNVPRYPISTSFADLDDFALRVRSRPLAVEVLSPSEAVLAADADSPTLELRVLGSAPPINTVQCFASTPGGVTIDADPHHHILRVRANGRLPAGRSKYTCTAPVAGERGTFYWYSHQWIKPNRDGSWPPG